MPLSEARRKQLDGIVVQLAEQDAPEEDVQAIVSDFKSKYENETTTAEAPAGPSKAAQALKAIVPDIDKPLTEEKTINTGSSYADVYGLQKPAPQTVPTSGLDKTIEGVGRVVGGAAGVPARGLGKLLGQGDMGDPETGALRGVREAVSKSSLPTPVKVGLDIGSRIIEDPTTFVGGGVGLAKAAKLNKSAKVADQVVKASDEVLAASDLAGRAGTHSGTMKVPLTKGQQAAAGGIPADMNLDKVIKAEADIKAKHPAIWEQFTKGQDAAITGKVGDIRAKRGMEATASAELDKDIVSSIMDHAETRSKALKAEYNKLEAVGNGKPLMENPLMDAAFHEMDRHNFYPTRLVEHPNDAGRMISVPKFTEKKLVKKTDSVHGSSLTTEQTKLPDQQVPYKVRTPEAAQFEDVKVGEDTHSGAPIFERREKPGTTTTETRTATIPGQTVEKEVTTPETYRYDRLQEVVSKVEREGRWTNGVSERVADGVTDARRIVDDNMTYSGLKGARTRIGNLKKELRMDKTGVGPQDFTVLDDIYGKLTNAMEEQIRLSWGDEAVKTWKATDALYAKKDAFAKLQHILSSVEPEQAIKNLTHSTKIDNLEALQSVKSLESSGVLPSGTFQSLQNAQFNRIVERATRNGVIDGDLLLAQVKKIPVEHYNTVFSGGLEDDMAQLVMEAVGTTLARRKSFPVNNPGAVVQAVKDIGGNAGVITLMTLGRKAWAATKVVDFARSFMAAKSPKAAADYLRQVDQKSLKAAFFKGALKTGAAMEAGKALSAPGSTEAASPSLEGQE